MNIYFCGIGGVGLGPLAELSLDAGHTVQGSDTDEGLMTKQLEERGVHVSTEQKGMFLQKTHEQHPIDWFVYTSALPPDHPELALAKMLGIKTSKRDELILHILEEKNLKLVAIAGTHGKTTTTAMLVWTLGQLGVPVSYSIGTTMPFGPSGKYDPDSEYFVYESDEFDRNFLRFHPHLSLITAMGYDHSDTYGTPEDYIAAFRQFLDQSDGSILWRRDANVLGDLQNAWILGDREIADVNLRGRHNRQNASLVVKAVERLGIEGSAVEAIDRFPGIDRRFEKLAENLYTDYGHHPEEIAATLQLASELNDDVVLVYQPHQNLRQHEFRTQYTDCFEKARDVYWLPTYLTREDPSLPILTPEELTEDITNRDAVHLAEMNEALWENIQMARDRGALVLVMGAGSIDKWSREMAATRHVASVLILDREGNFVLQHRDDKPDITSAGKLSTFGGSVEPDDASLRDAAIRELREETNLPFNPDDLAFFKLRFETNERDEPVIKAYYVLAGVSTDQLEVYEGQGFERVNPNDLGKFPLSVSTRVIIAEYTHPSLV